MSRYKSPGSYKGEHKASNLRSFGLKNGGKGHSVSTTLSPRSRSLKQLNSELAEVSRMKSRSKDIPPIPAPRTAVPVRQKKGREVEMEYTHNLQQQIYFLELECQYLKMNKGGEGGGTSGDISEMQSNGLPMSIQHQLRQVKETYDQMEYNQQLELNEIRAEKRKLEDHVVRLESTVESLNNKVVEHKDEYREGESAQDIKWDTLLSERISLEKNIISLKETLETVTNEKHEITLKREAEKKELLAEINSLRSKIENDKAEVAQTESLNSQLENELKTWQINAAEMNDAFEKASASEAASRGLAKKQTSALHEAVSTLEKTSLKLDQEHTFASKMQIEYDRLLDTKISFEHRVSELESELSAAHELRNSAQQQLQESGVQCNALRRQAEADEKALRVAEEVAIGAKHKDDTQSKLLSRVQKELDETLLKLEDMKSKAEKIGGKYISLDIENTKLRAVNERLETKYKECGEKASGLSLELKSLKEIQIDLNLEVSNLAKENNKLKKVESLNLAEIKQFAEANKQVMSKMEAFMSVHST